jgi:hypothetical protein
MKTKLLSAYFKIICNILRVPENLLKKKCRKTEIVFARAYFYCFIYDLFNQKDGIKISSTELGLFLNQNHATVLYLLKFRKNEIDFEKNFENLKKQIYNYIESQEKNLELLKIIENVQILN